MCLSVSITRNMEAIDDGHGNSGFCNAICSGMGGRDGNAFVELWHPEGLLHTPLVNRAVAASELNRLMEVQTAAAPDFVWQLLDWTSRGEVVIIEWQTTRIVNGERFSWRGVDKFRIKAGKIIEERVYCDTAPLRALRTGETLEPITRF
jgi:ketosteroid isomerase-like protein